VPPTASNNEIAARVYAELHHSYWIGNSSIGIQVTKGVAILEGVIHDEWTRKAIPVAAKTVPCVTAIQN
jgi:osmotically-inducible protein OsmY